MIAHVSGQQSNDLKVCHCTDTLLWCPQMNPAVTQLSLYDVANVKGVAADVSHVNSRARVEVGGLLVESAVPLSNWACI